MEYQYKKIKIIVILLAVSLGIFLVRYEQKNRVEAAGAVRFPWMNNLTLWPVGVDLAWQDWDQDFSDNGWEARFVKIKAQLDIMASQGVRALRWWVFPDGNVAPLFSGTGEGSRCTGLPDKWIDHMVEMADYAKTKDIRLYFCFTSFDWGYNNRAWNHDDIFDNAPVRQSFLDNAVKPILQALGTHEGILGWDIINEPEWLIKSADGGDPNSACESFSLADMRAFAREMADYVHTYAKQPVSVGSASMKWCGGQYQFWTGLGLDFYDFHWYDWATPYFNPLKTAPTALGLDKPCIIGEMMPNPESSSLKMTHQQILEGLYANGYCGYMPWSWNDNAYDCKPYINPSFNNFEAAHPDVNQIQGFGTSPTVTPTTVTAAPSATPGVTVSPFVTASPSATATVEPTVSVTLSPPVTPVTGSCAVAYTQYDWGSGATVNITIKNTGSSAVNGWKLGFGFTGNQKITNMWGGSFTQSGTSVTLANESYNAVIPVGGSVSCGFCLNYSGTNAKPTGFTVNGSPAISN